MTLFVVLCIALLAIAIGLVARPLLKSHAKVESTDQVSTKKKSKKEEQATVSAPKRSYGAVVAIAIAIPVVAGVLYAKVGRWNWEADLASARSTEPAQPNVQAMVTKLEQRLKEKPNDIDGWLMLGRSYATLGRMQDSMAAYQRAFDLSRGENVEAILGVAEAMVTLDERTIAGRAGELFEAALAKQPDNPKALWYSALTSLALQQLPRAHERLQKMLSLNPPENIRSIIERQLQDIEQQLGQSTQPASQKKEPAAVSRRTLTVQVDIAPSVKQNWDKRTPLFVLVRPQGAQGGPPLAAVRRAFDDLPLTVTITNNDAMMQGRGIDSVQRATVVARVSKSGTPQAQPGDVYGEVDVDFARGDKQTIQVLIDKDVAQK